MGYGILKGGTNEFNLVPVERAPEDNLNKENWPITSETQINYFWIDCGHIHNKTLILRAL